MMTRFSIYGELLLELAPFPLLLLACVVVVCLGGGGVRKWRVEFFFGMALQRRKLDWLGIGEEFNRHDALQQRRFLCVTLACECATPIRFWNESA
jgi:hypothetical protein